MDCGFWRYQPYADIRRASLVRWCQMRVWTSKMRVFSVDRNIFRMKFPIRFTYRNLHGFARLPARARLVLTIVLLLSQDIHTRTWYEHSYFTKVQEVINQRHLNDDISVLRQVVPTVHTDSCSGRYSTRILSTLGVAPYGRFSYDRAHIRQPDDEIVWSIRYDNNEQQESVLIQTVNFYKYQSILPCNELMN